MKCTEYMQRMILDVLLMDSNAQVRHASALQSHMETHDISIEMPSLISNADDSSWKYVVCPECDGKFEYE